MDATEREEFEAWLDSLELDDSDIVWSEGPFWIRKEPSIAMNPNPERKESATTGNRELDYQNHMRSMFPLFLLLVFVFNVCFWGWILGFDPAFSAVAQCPGEVQLPLEPIPKTEPLPVPVQ